MRLRTIARASLIAGLAVLSPGLVPDAAAQQPAEKQYRIRTRTEVFVKTHTLAPLPGDEDGVKLGKARLGAALNEMMHRTREFLRDSAQTERLLDSGLRVLDAELDYYGAAKDRIGVLEKHLELSRELAGIVEERAKADLASIAEVEYARYCMSSIELALHNARREAAR